MANIFQTRNNINSLFGLYSAARASGAITYASNDITTAAVRLKLQLETQTGKEYYKNGRLAKFLQNPERYLSLRGQVLQERLEIITNQLKLEFAEYLNNGFSQKEAETKIMQKYKKLEQEEKDYINNLFPVPDNFKPL